MSQIGFKQAKRRYFRLFWPAMAVYVVIILGGVWWLKQFETEPLWLQVGVAVGATIPVIASLGIMLRYAFETDEFQRRMQLESLAISGVILTCVIFLVGFLQLFEVIESFEVFWFGPAFMLLHGLVTLIRGGRGCL